MKYAGKEISEMHDLVLIQTLQNFNEQLRIRNEASKHRKFDKTYSKNVGEFPPPNPAFIELKSALENEMKARKLDK